MALFLCGESIHSEIEWCLHSKRKRRKRYRVLVAFKPLIPESKPSLCIFYASNVQPFLQVYVIHNNFVCLPKQVQDLLLSLHSFIYSFIQQILIECQLCASSGLYWERKWIKSCCTELPFSWGRRYSSAGCSPNKYHVLWEIRKGVCTVANRWQHWSSEKIYSWPHVL